MPKNYDKNVKCSFCGKPQEAVKKIIAGPGVYICDECISVCENILEEEIYDNEEETVLVEETPTPEEIKNIYDVSKMEGFKGKVILLENYSNYYF